MRAFAVSTDSLRDAARTVDDAATAFEATAAMQAPTEVGHFDLADAVAELATSLGEDRRAQSSAMRAVADGLEQTAATYEDGDSESRSRFGGGTF